MGRSAVLIALIAPMALTAGCVQRTLNINSDPPGALVYLNDQEIGRTPVSRDFTWYGKYDVQLRMEGYETLDAKMNVVAPVWLWPPFDLVAELVPGHIKDIRNQSFKLKPATTQPFDEAAFLARSDELKAKLQSSRYTQTVTTHPATATSQ